LAEPLPMTARVEVSLPCFLHNRRPI